MLSNNISMVVSGAGCFARAILVPVLSPALSVAEAVCTFSGLVKNAAVNGPSLLERNAGIVDAEGVKNNRVCQTMINVLSSAKKYVVAFLVHIKYFIAPPTRENIPELLGRATDALNAGNVLLFNVIAHACTAYTNPAQMTSLLKCVVAASNDVVIERFIYNYSSALTVEQVDSIYTYALKEQKDEIIKALVDSYWRALTVEQRDSYALTVEQVNSIYTYALEGQKDAIIKALVRSCWSVLTVEQVNSIFTYALEGQKDAIIKALAFWHPSALTVEQRGSIFTYALEANNNNLLYSLLISNNPNLSISELEYLCEIALETKNATLVLALRPPEWNSNRL